jgi:CTD nuclear envelope phosphatase 1
VQVGESDSEFGAFFRDLARARLGTQLVIVVTPRAMRLTLSPSKSQPVSPTTPRLSLGALSRNLLRLRVHGLCQSMNSLNIITHIGNTPPPSPPRSRTASESNLLLAQSRSQLPRDSNDAGAEPVASLDNKGNMVSRRVQASSHPDADAVTSGGGVDEKTPLLSHSSEGPFEEAQISRVWLLPKRISDGLVGSLKVLLAAITTPVTYLIAWFYDDDGHFSILTPVYKLSRGLTRRKRKGPSLQPVAVASDLSEKDRRKSRRTGTSQSKAKRQTKRSPSIASTSAVTSDSEQESERVASRADDNNSPSRHTRSKSNASSTTEEIAPAKRSIRIKLHTDEALRQRKTKKSSRRVSTTDQVSPEVAASLKSPTGSATVPSKQLTKFPRAPQPPRPLVPRRQPSYSTTGTAAVGPHQKTLIIDLDETLIHSMAKGGRYTTGHMVEVKLNQPVPTAGAQVIGPQVPILYYVHKRPHCDEFLKKVGRFLLVSGNLADSCIRWPSGTT